MNTKPVKSSYISEIGHHPATNTMRVKFPSGAVYDYANVKEQQVASLLNSKSIGSHFIKLFKGNPLFPCKKISGPTPKTAAK